MSETESDEDTEDTLTSTEDEGSDEEWVRAGLGMR